MRPWMTAGLFGLLAFATAAPAEANWFTDFWVGVHRDFRRNNCWPEPFVAPDREAVRAPFAVMVANGWRMQNTLADEHFMSGTLELNEAGRLKVRSILDVSPVEHRAIYVVRGPSAHETAARIDAVQQHVVQVLPHGDLPAVLETQTGPTGWSADYVDRIDRKFQSTTPDPRLPPLRAESRD